MKKDLPTDKLLVSISKAAEVLDVSIDTIRRWEKAGTLKCVRPNGKDRYFSVEELEKHRFSKPLSISQASEQLGVSTTTLRRLEKKGLIKPERNGNRERMYNKDSLKEFLDSQYFLKKRGVRSKILETLESKEDKAVPIKPTVADRAQETERVVGSMIHETRPEPAESSEEIHLASNLKPWQRIPEIVVASMVFVLLVTFGMRNITVSASERPELAVLGIKTIPFTTESTMLSPTPTPTPTLTPTPVVMEEVKPKVMLTVKIEEASANASVNIRQKPTAKSEKVGKAKDGDIFEFVSIDSGWYEVKLADDATGFISAIYIVKEEGKNDDR